MVSTVLSAQTVFTSIRLMVRGGLRGYAVCDFPAEEVYSGLCLFPGIPGVVCGGLRFSGIPLFRLMWTVCQKNRMTPNTV